MGGEGGAGGESVVDGASVLVLEEVCGDAEIMCGVCVFVCVCTCICIIYIYILYLYVYICNYICTYIVGRGGGRGAGVAGRTVV